jgi:hypothetical protein
LLLKDGKAPEKPFCEEIDFYFFFVAKSQKISRKCLKMHFKLFFLVKEIFNKDFTSLV